MALKAQDFDTPPPGARELLHAADACEKTAEGIRAVAGAAQKLLSGPLTRRAVALLIRDTLPRGSKMELTEILDVLDAAAGLAARHTRKVP